MNVTSALFDVGLCLDNSSLAGFSFKTRYNYVAHAGQKLAG